MNTKRTALLIGLISTVAFSTTDAEARKNFRSGVYLGAEAGWLHDHIDFNRTIMDGNLAFLNRAFNGSKKSSHKNANSFFPGIFVGYRHFMECYFLGAEFGAYLNLGKKSSTVMSPEFAIDAASLKQSYKGEYNLIPTLNIGRSFNEHWAIFGKIGADFSRYKYSIKEMATGVGITQKRHQHKNVARLIIGGGVEYAVNCIWSLRSDVTYSFKNSKKGLTMTATAPQAIHNYKSHTRVGSLAVKAGVFAKL